MKKIVLISILLMAFFLVGCAETATEKAMEAKIESESGGEAEVDIDMDSDGGTMKVTTDEGEVEIEASGMDSDEWCKTGAQWKFSSTTQQQTGEWKIEGLIGSGDYKGLCHVVYTAQGAQGVARMDYYFSQDGETGYFEMEANGQKIKSEWHG